MLSFTLVKDKIVLDPNIILFKELHDLYKDKQGLKLLQTIYYLHSRDDENPFRDLDKSVLEENVIFTLFKKKGIAELNLSKSTYEKFVKAEKIFKKYNTTPEKRLLESVDKKLDEITTMLDDNKPVIEESITKSGETKFNTNLTIMLNAFSKIETIMKSKTLLKSAIAKDENRGRNRADRKTSYREKRAARTK